MATLNQVLAEQAKLIGGAKKTLEAAQNNKPPTTNAPIVVKEATVAELTVRVTNLTAAKADAVRQIDEQIGAYKKEIAVLQKQIDEDKKLLNI